MAKPVRYESAHEDVLREGGLDQAIHLVLLRSQGVRVAMLRERVPAFPHACAVLNFSCFSSPRYAASHVCASVLNLNYSGLPGL